MIASGDFGFGFALGVIVTIMVGLVLAGVFALGLDMGSKDR